MKKQFCIYDCVSKLFLSLNDDKVIWNENPLFFDSENVAENTMCFFYEKNKSDFNNKIVSIISVFVN